MALLIINLILLFLQLLFKFLNHVLEFIGESHFGHLFKILDRVHTIIEYR